MPAAAGLVWVVRWMHVLQSLSWLHSVSPRCFRVLLLARGKRQCRQLLQELLLVVLPPAAWADWTLAADKLQSCVLAAVQSQSGRQQYR